MTEEQMRAEYTADMERMEAEATAELARCWFQRGVLAGLLQAREDLELALSRAEGLTRIHDRIAAFGDDA